jgi:hypothetical protein
VATKDGLLATKHLVPGGPQRPAERDHRPQMGSPRPTQEQRAHVPTIAPPARRPLVSGSGENTYRLPELSPYPTGGAGTRVVDMEQPRKPKGGGVLSALLEVALSIGGYYLLRAFDVNVFWALTVPATIVAVVTVVVTVRRGRTDMIGLLVVLELVATITLSLATQSARIAALREPVYILIGGVFCLATLFHRTPFSHVSTTSIATFRDPKTTVPWSPCTPARRRCAACRTRRSR